MAQQRQSVSVLFFKSHRDSDSLLPLLNPRVDVSKHLLERREVMNLVSKALVPRGPKLPRPIDPPQARLRSIPRPVQGVAQALDAPDGSYDIVVSSLVVNHLSDTLRPPALREMVRVLRLGYRVLIADFRPPTS
jgi:SAM-dependent methyltransferase